MLDGLDGTALGDAGRSDAGFGTRHRAGTNDGPGMQPAGAGGMGDLVFNNSSLKAVFERLSLQYHKKIVYRASELAGLNFTGTLMRTDSLDTILSLLGTMNNLDIHEQPAGFVVTRRQDNP